MTENTLKLKKTKLLLFHTRIHQTEDGTTFYDVGNPPRLYVKCDGEKMCFDIRKVDPYTIMDEAEYRPMSVKGNILYFTAGVKIYSVVFTSSTSSIDVTYCRDILENETIDWRGLCTKKVRGPLSWENYAYRIGDDPNNDAILIDPEEKKIKENWKLFIGIHRKNAFYVKRNTNLTEPTVRILHDNGILIEAPFDFLIPFSRDSSPFFYFIDGHRRRAEEPVTDTNRYENYWTHKHLHTVNTDTMTFLPTLAFDTAYTYISNISVLGDKLTITGSENHFGFDGFPFHPPSFSDVEHQCKYPYEFHLVEAQLPEGYFPETTTVDALAAEMSALSAEANKSRIDKSDAGQ